MSSRWDDGPAAHAPHASIATRWSGSVGLRIAIWYAAIFVTSTIALVVLTYALLSSSLTQRDHEIIRSTLREYASRYEAGGLPALARAVELEVRSGRHERLFVRVLGPGRDALFFSLPPEWSEFDVDDLPRGTGRSSGSGVDGFGRTRSDGDTWAATRARDRSALLEVASLRLWDGTIVQVGKSTESRDELLRHFRAVVGLVSLVVIAAGVAGGIALTRSTLRPLRRLIDVVRGIIRTGRTEARVPVAVTTDAVDELSALFNVMLDRITTLIAAMRDSLDNVAHDLRTPMARLRGIAERALQSGSPEAQREALADCLEESDRILAMLNTLMDISEAENGVLRLASDEVPLRALLGEVVELYEHVAEDERVRVAIEPGDEVTVAGDRDRLRQAFANLLDNAIKYTNPDGRVSIAVARGDARSGQAPAAGVDTGAGDADHAGEGGGDVAVVTIRDTGIGITPEDLPRIWDRLYRGDRSRAERGLGLGLSLVQAYVHAHGGRVTAASTPDEGSTFTVVLPRQPPTAPLSSTA